MVDGVTGLGGPSTELRTGPSTELRTGPSGGIGAPASIGGTEGSALRTADAAGFTEALERSQLEFSRHALKRIEQRQLQMDAPRLERLEHAVERAGAKGSRDSLILLDELALVVSVQNRTVLTAMDEATRKEHVFTNIDSVVIAE